jgi:ribosomal protein S27AE
MWIGGPRKLARLVTRTHEVTNNFCGKCGVIVSKHLDIYDHCPKCQEVIEP